MTRRTPEPDLPLSTIARALGWSTAEEFQARLPEYLARGFPEPDPTTGRIDPEAFERWRRLRNSRFFPELTIAPAARDAAAIQAERKQRRWQSAS